MPEEHHLTARNLLEQMNRQFNECNALYHELAVHYGVSDTVFWLLYSLYNSSEPQTQNRLCMEWNLPKQTMNSAVASMVKQGLLELEPAPGRYSGKLLHLTPAGRELAAKTAKPVYSAEQAALEQLGMAEAEHFVRLGQEHLDAIRTEFNKILQQEKVMNQRIQLSDHFTTSRILRFAASPIIMMVFTSIYSVVDGFFVSNFAGKQAFAAVNLIMPFLQAFGCIGFMLGTGGSALVAMTLGTGNKKRANELFSMLVCATAVLGVIFTVVALLVLRPAAVLLGATAELLDDCILYGTIITVFQTAFMLQFLFQSFFITAEKPKLGLFFTVAAGLTNMVLDFVFVGVMGLGITGAAAATVISQLIGGIGPMFYFARPGNGSLLHFVRPVFSGKALLKACTNGSSELMTNLSASLVGALYNWQLLRLGGADGVAAYGVIMYVSFFFAAIFIGYAQGCAPVVSYHYGADNTDELKNLLRISLRVIAVGGVAMLCFSELLTAPLSRFFVGYDAELLELTTLGMKLYSLSFLLCGFNIFGSAFFTALNNGIVSAVISFLRTLVFQVTAILVLPQLLGMNGIWLSVVAAEIAALFVNAFFLVKNRKKYQY